MKKILIYGDSNVWGDNFVSGKRIPDDKQWVNILREKLVDKYIIFQEGLPGRIAGNDEILKKYKNGKSNFISTFRTNAPVDVIIIALGTNDLQIKYDKDSLDIINDLLWYRNIVFDSYNNLDDRKKFFANKKMPQIIYILPINFDYKNRASDVFNKDSEEKRQNIINYFKKNNIKSLILNDMPLFEDGIHLNYDGHRLLSELVEGVILENDQ